MDNEVIIKRALISVSDKSGIVNFAKKLHQHGIEIISTGGTYKILTENNVPVIEVSELTNFKEIMQGRVKTLHPKIHGGILSRRDLDQDVMESEGILPIDLVVVNLYPFEATVAQENCSIKTAIENIDIGGPTMIRAAAKNYQFVTVAVEQEDYLSIIQAINENRSVSSSLRFQLAVKAFEHVTLYDAAISNYLGSKSKQLEDQSNYPKTLITQYKKVKDLRYGENPHQAAALYCNGRRLEGTVVSAQQIQGKALSFNNIVDAETALECVKSFKKPSCVIVKHANPCGVASSENLLSAYQKAFITDSVSAFGGVIAFNNKLDEKTVRAIIEKQFVEVIVAPSIGDGVQDILLSKPNVRMLICGLWKEQKKSFMDIKRIQGGILVQDSDQKIINMNDIEIVTNRKPTDQELADLMFAWSVAKFVKSNAIVYAKNNKTIGVGAGQMSRVFSAKIANLKAQDAQLDIFGSVMASDAFFPFRDGLDEAAKEGVTAVIQPGGSRRDQEVIDAANEANMAMAFTKIRHFKH